MKHRLGTPLPWLVLLSCSGVLLTLGGTPTWWLGGALLWGAVALGYQGRNTFLAPFLRRKTDGKGDGQDGGRQPTDRLRFLYPLVLTTIGLLMMSSALLDERPVSHDHTVHYVKAWQLKEYLLPSGRLFGWSHRFFAGYPANYLYPIGADLWLVLFYGLGFSALTFSQAYGLAFAAFFTLQGIAGYRFGTAFFNRHVGFITGLLLLTDLSDFRMGGWAYSIEFGVWPQALALAFSLLALSELPRLFAGNDLRALSLFGLFMGLSILSHPVVLIFLSLLLVTCVIASLLSDNMPTLSGTVRLLGGCVLALAVSSLWLIPFLSTRKYTSAMGVFWDTTYQMGRDLLSLSTFKGTLPAALGLGLIALFFALRTRQFCKLFIALGALLIPLVSSSSFVDELHLAQLSPAFTKIQFLRMTTMVKPLWFALAGFALVSIASFARQHLPERSASPAPHNYVRTTAIHVLVAFLTLPFLVPLGQVFAVDHVLKHQRTVHDREYSKERLELTRYLRKHLPEDGFHRLGIFMGHNHELIDLSAELDVPIYKHGFTPCTNFIYKMQGQDTEVLKAVRVRYVISKQPLSGSDFRQIKRFGIYGLYEFLHYNPQPFDILQGRAQVHMRRFEDERIAFDVEAGSSGQLQLPISWFPRWQATRDGHALKITQRSLPAEPDKTGFITLPLAAGHYEVYFERSTSDRLAMFLGLGSIALCLLLWLGSHSPRVRERATRMLTPLQRLDQLSAPRFRSLRLTAMGAFSILFLVVFSALALWHPPLLPDAYTGYKPVKQVRYDFVEEMADASAVVRFSDYGRHCRPLGDRLVCPDSQGHFDSDRFVGSQPTTIEEYRMVRCIRARPQEGAALEINFPQVPRGRRLLGYYGIDFESRLLFYRRPVDFEVHVNGKSAYKHATERDNHMHWFEIPMPKGRGKVSVTFSISAANPSMRWFCFEAQMADG